MADDQTQRPRSLLARLRGRRPEKKPKEVDDLEEWLEEMSQTDAKLTREDDS